jgi:hypothetical protein
VTLSLVEFSRFLGGSILEKSCGGGGGGGLEKTLVIAKRARTLFEKTTSSTPIRRQSQRQITTDINFQHGARKHWC